MGHHRVNAYYPLVGLELCGALKLRPMCRVVQCSAGFVVLHVLDIVGKILWSIISSSYERLSVESRDAPQRRRHCVAGWWLRVHTAARSGLFLGWRFGLYGVLHIMRCCCRAVWLLLLHAAEEPCRVLCVFAGPGCAPIRK